MNLMTSPAKQTLVAHFLHRLFVDADQPAIQIKSDGAFRVRTWNEVAAELAAEDEMFKKVWDDLQEFRAGYKIWSNNIYLPRPR